MNFIVTFRAAPGSDGIRSLRALLKIARRRFSLIAVDAREATDTVEPPDAENPDLPAISRTHPLNHNRPELIRQNTATTTTAKDRLS